MELIYDRIRSRNFLKIYSVIGFEIVRLGVHASSRVCVCVCVCVCLHVCVINNKGSRVQTNVIVWSSECV